MKATFEIPDELRAEFGIDQSEAEAILQQELAVAFYSRGW